MKGCKVKLMEAKILCNRLREEINEYKSKISSDIAESKEDLNNQLANKQDKLISGTNIKTINGTSLLGSGDIVIQGGGSGGTSIEAFTIVDVEEPPFAVKSEKFFNSLKTALGGFNFPTKPLLLKYETFYFLVLQENVFALEDAIYIKMFGGLGESVLKYTPTSPFMVTLLNTNDRGNSRTDWFNETINFGSTEVQSLTLKSGIEMQDIDLICTTFNWVDCIEIGSSDDLRRLKLDRTGTFGILFSLPILNATDKQLETNALLIEKNGSIEFSILKSTIQ